MQLHACLLLNIHLTQQLTKCCVFSFCSILLNAYNTHTERAKRVTFDQVDSTIGSGVLVK